MTRRLSFLDGLKVVEIGDSVATAAAGALLFRLGASVGWVEGRWDSKGPASEWKAGRQEAAVKSLLRRGKTFLGQWEPQDQDQWEARLQEIVSAGADVILLDIAGFGAAWTESISRRYLTVVDRMNRGSWVTISPFGIGDSDFTTFRGSELTYLASSGLLWCTRDANGRPLAPAGYQASYAVGHVAALAALDGVSRGPISSWHFDISAQEAVIALASFLECTHALFNCPGGGGARRYVEPQGMYPCLDGRVMIMALQDHHWQGVIRAMGSPTWAVDLVTSQDRAKQGGLIREEVSSWTRCQDKEKCARSLQECGVPATAVNGSEELSHDRETVDLYFESIDFGTRKVEVPGLPLREVPSEPNSQAGTSTDEFPRCRAKRVGIAGLRVLDLTHVLAGPLATSWLGAMGADVVKVEDPSRPDSYRFAGSAIDGVAGFDRGAYYAALNHSKRNCALNLRQESGQKQLRQLYRWADVVVENHSKARANEIGITATNVWSENGKCLFISSSGFGRHGERSDYRVYGKNIHAHAGLIASTVGLDGESYDVGTTLADPLTAVWIACLITAYGIRRKASRVGFEISMAQVLEYQLSEFFILGREVWPDERGSCVQCADTDRWLAVAPESESQVLASVGEDESLDFGVKRDVFKGYDRDELYMALGSAGAKVAPVWSPAELTGSGHLARRRFFTSVAHPVWGSRRIIAPPWREVGRSDWALTRPRLLGEDTAEVLESKDA